MTFIIFQTLFSPRRKFVQPLSTHDFLVHVHLDLGNSPRI